MNAGDIYTHHRIGHWSGARRGKRLLPATATQIAGAQSLATDADGDLYIADEQDNRIEEIANVSGTQWGQSMTAEHDEYTVVGSFNRDASGNSGDGGPATAALLSNTESVSIDPQGDLYITDSANDTVREVASATANAIAPAPGPTRALVIAPGGTAPGGITVTQPGGAQVTFWAQASGACATGYKATGSYCSLLQDQGATLTYGHRGHHHGVYLQPRLRIDHLHLPNERHHRAADQRNRHRREHPHHHRQLASPRRNRDRQRHLPHQRPQLPDHHLRIRPRPHPRLQRGLRRRPGHLRHRPHEPDLDLRLHRITPHLLHRSGTQQLNASQHDHLHSTTSVNANPLLVNDLTTITSPNAQSGGPGRRMIQRQSATAPPGRSPTSTDPMGWKTTYQLLERMPQQASARIPPPAT